ncbi:hypothetical protein UNDKW_3688 [Undibacterium sp. KW1]|nr:hypothetical protein UNDKW_3688 [Undibacterium sp. KW1]
MHNHAICDGGGATGDGAGLPFDFHQAQPACAYGFESVVMAGVGWLAALVAHGLQEAAAFCYGACLAIYADVKHVCNSAW